MAMDIGGILRKVETRLAGRFWVDARFQKPLAVSISTAVRNTVAASLVNCGKQIDVDTMCPREYFLFEFDVASDRWAWALEIGSCRRTASPIHGIVVRGVRGKPRNGSIDSSMIR
jgi:hypothetical protein